MAHPQARHPVQSQRGHEQIQTSLKYLKANQDSERTPCVTTPDDHQLPAHITHTPASKETASIPESTPRELAIAQLELDSERRPSVTAPDDHQGLEVIKADVAFELVIVHGQTEYYGHVSIDKEETVKASSEMSPLDFKAARCRAGFSLNFDRVTKDAAFVPPSSGSLLHFKGSEPTDSPQDVSTRYQPGFIQQIAQHPLPLRASSQGGNARG